MLRGRRPSERAAAHLQLLLAQLPSSFVWTTSDDLRLTSIAGAALSLIGLGDAEAFIGDKLETILAGGPRRRRRDRHRARAGPAGRVDAPDGVDAALDLRRARRAAA
jgi:hypothetical protein